MKVLLSIKPEYAERILDGSKKYEFRKKIHRDSRVRSVVIYATKPVGKVVGEFTIRQIHSESPGALWRKTKNYSGISKKFFSSYFEGRNLGHAIEVDRVEKYKTPMPIGAFLSSGVPPQSYAYLRE